MFGPTKSKAEEEGKITSWRDTSKNCYGLGMYGKVRTNFYA